VERAKGVQTPRFDGQLDEQQDADGTSEQVALLAIPRGGDRLQNSRQDDGFSAMDGSVGHFTLHAAAVLFSDLQS
jgi:hypothetical protein